MDKERLKDTRPIEVPFQTLSNGLDLMGRLDELTLQKPKKYPHDSIARVRQLVQYEVDHPGIRRPYKLFKDVRDFKLYFRLHSEWQGRLPMEMINDKESGAHAFYEAFSKWSRVEFKGDVKKRRELMEYIFTFQHRLYRTIDDWIKEFQSHSEWQGRSPKEMIKDKESGAAAFYTSFRRWKIAESGGDVKKSRELTEKIFSPKHPTYVHFTNIEDWINEFNKHPKWQRRSSTQMERDRKSGASAFYKAVWAWVKKESSGDKKKKKELIGQIFSHRKNVWTHLTSIEDWVEEFNKHPEWQGKKPREVYDNKKLGAFAFYIAFLAWGRKTAKSEEEREAFMDTIFPDRQKRLRERNIFADGKSISSEEAMEDLMRLFEEEPD